VHRDVDEPADARALLAELDAVRAQHAGTQARTGATHGGPGAERDRSRAGDGELPECPRTHAELARLFGAG
jgi:hypothetical protein